MSAPFVFAAMGTVVSLHTHARLARATEDAVLTAFVTLEERFSTWRADSEGSRLSRHEITLLQVTPEFRSVYDEAIAWRAATEGAFTPHRPDGMVDLSGLVKARALADAGEALAAHGEQDWCLNAGGDVLTSGVRTDGTPWVVGIVDPRDRRSLLSQATTGPGRRAVATSGVAERGEHVWRLGADDRFSQVTVVAGDIVTADVLATAILAGGTGALARAHDLAEVEVLACGATGEFWATRAFRAPLLSRT